jgi:hypothetical protein
VQFTKRLREGVRSGDITCSVRIWKQPRVKVGGRYRMEGGEIQVDSIQQIELRDITPELARRSGCLGVVDLLKVAKHGRGRNVYLVRFHYRPDPRERETIPRARRRPGGLTGAPPRGTLAPMSIGLSRTYPGSFGTRASCRERCALVLMASNG